MLYLAELGLLQYADERRVVSKAGEPKVVSEVGV